MGILVPLPGSAARRCAAVFVLAAALAAGCGAGEAKPAAAVGDETITRGFLSHAMKKLGRGEKGAPPRKEVLSSIIEGCLVARKAREAGLDRGAEYGAALPGVLSRARRDFLCEELGLGGECSDALYFHLVKKEGLTVPQVRWERLFVTVRRPDIPLGGAIPAVSRGGGLPEPDRDYAATVKIVSRIVKTDLASLMDRAGDEARAALSDGAVRDRALRDLVTDAHLEAMKKALPPRRRALLGEIEARAGQALLAEIYRKSIGFESLSGGRSAKVRYSVTDGEARAFYDANPALFEEPVAVTLRHIRVKDHDTAKKVRESLVKDPASFCGAAAKHSIAPDAAKCGDLGRVVRKQKIPLVMEMGFTLAKPGELSVPFSTPDGVEIVQLVKREVRRRPWEDPAARELAAVKMQGALREKRLAADIAEMKKRHPVKVFE